MRSWSLSLASGLLAIGCVEPTPFELEVPADVSDLAVVELDGAGEVVSATPFAAYRSDAPFVFRDVGERAWAVVGYGEVEGRRLTGEIPRTAGALEPTLPEPDFFWLEPGPALNPPTELRPLTTATPLNQGLPCPPTEPRELILSCPDVFAWQAIQRNPSSCAWEATNTQSAPGLPERISGQVDAAGAFRALELEEDGISYPCRSEDEEFVCPAQGRTCRVAIQSTTASVPGIDLLRGRIPPRRAVDVRCNIVPASRRTVGPLLDFLPGAPSLALVFEETPRSDDGCFDPVCIPLSRLTSFTTAPASSELRLERERRGRFARMFEVPGDPTRFGTLEMAVPPGETCDPQAGRAPAGTSWQFVLRERSDLSPVWTATLAAARPGARAQLVIDVEVLTDPPGVVAQVGDSSEIGPRSVFHYIDLASFPPVAYAADAQRVRQLAKSLSLQTTGVGVIAVAEDGWIACSIDSIRRDDVASCDFLTTVPPGVDLIVMSSWVLSSQRRAVGRRGTIAIESLSGEPQEIRIGGLPGFPVPTAYLLLGARLYVAVSEPLMTPEARLLVYDLVGQSFLPRTINLGPGWINELLFDGIEIRAMNATEGVVHAIPPGAGW